MEISSALRRLAAFLDECKGEVRVSSVELLDETPGSNGVLTADIELSISMCPADEGMIRTMSVDSDGILRFELESTNVVPVTDHNVAVEPTDVTFASNRVIVTLSASVLTENESARLSEDKREEPNETTEPSDDPTPTTSDQLPPFKNPELLAEVYESCNTFTEMPDALGMDVTAETVRRYMIDYGIHEPNSYNTTTKIDNSDDSSTDIGDDDTETESEKTSASVTQSGGELQEPVVLADGVGLPEDVTVETIIETVRESNTIHEVKRDIGIERENTLDMLQELNLLDLVVGRLATEDERKISREEVIERLRTVDV